VCLSFGFRTQLFNVSQEAEGLEDEEFDGKEPKYEPIGEIQENWVKWD